MKARIGEINTRPNLGPDLLLIGSRLPAAEVKRKEKEKKIPITDGDNTQRCKRARLGEAATVSE